MLTTCSRTDMPVGCQTVCQFATLVSEACHEFVRADFRGLEAANLFGNCEARHRDVIPGKQRGPVKNTVNNTGRNSHADAGYADKAIQAKCERTPSNRDQDVRHTARARACGTAVSVKLTFVWRVLAALCGGTSGEFAGLRLTALLGRCARLMPTVNG